MSPSALSFHQKSITLIHHAAQHDHHAPPGSLSALEGCLGAGAAVVEIDVIPLADGSFALLHDQDLAKETNGAGKAPQMTREGVQHLCYRLNGQLSDEKVGFLEGAIDLLAAHPHTQRLQLDLKPFTPLPQAVLQNFLALIEPVKARIQVSSVADWVIRALATAAPDLALGFDPLLYLDLVEDEPRPENIPPFRVGAYGLLDDHPLSAYRWGQPGDYFAARASALLAQAPAGCDWFIRAEVLRMALDAGFNWIVFLHQHGSKVVGWTIDVEQPGQIDLARQLVEQGIDALTTDTPSRLAAHLAVETIV
jgi:glycerophosphoryl diester phosphodiesterase